MKQSRMPSFYPQGGPLYYGDDVSGKLPRAVIDFFDAALGRKTLHPDTLELVRDYCQYYINAPCWDMNPYHDEESRAMLTRLRTQIEEIVSIRMLDEWIHACLDVGIDPL